MSLLNDLFVFEMANNHQGSVAHGLKIIEAAARISRNHRVRGSVKLQFRELDSFIHPDWKGREDVKHLPRFESTKLSVAEFGQLVRAIRDEGLVAMATPFDEASVGTCLDLGVEIIKIASCSATDWPLLEAVADARKPVVASTGGLSIYEIDNLVSFFRKRVPEFALMHCVSTYPTPPEDVCLGFMDKLIKRYPYISVGYSGHEAPDDTDVVQAAIAKGARLVERHMGVPTDDVKLNAYSVNPEQADAWVAAAERARTLCGTDETKHTSQEEIDSLRSLQRGVWAKRAIKTGETIQPEDVFFAMPLQDGQLTSGEFGRLRAHHVATQDYAAGEAVTEHASEDPMSEFRGILHDAKGMIYEAGIELGDDYTIEISHHYGLERFRQVGCVLVNLINREYCEKILLQLPGQRHPTHRHEQKEETFRLLWGDLEVELNGVTHHLEAGDKLLVERGARHNFRTTGGAIFAEISTTSIVGDSFYDDPAIAELDPMQRKTILESW
ncbi:MAG: N-acetylneuraminate synthase family protein [Myxococcota bacterium]|nr:N-acetylneuraminate synthase family protein [Myxococcota bacterium]